MGFTISTELGAVFVPLMVAVPGAFMLTVAAMVALIVAYEKRAQK
jgi:hypothetical protein